jgi:hypothetical protein
MEPTSPQTCAPCHFGTDQRDDGLCIGLARAGRCYELAGAAVLTMLVDAVLVYGSVRQPGSTEHAASYEHAWVVLADGQDWEPTQARLWDARLFGCLMQSVATNVYALSELCNAITRSGHWGAFLGMNGRTHRNQASVSAGAIEACGPCGEHMLRSRAHR